MVTWKSTKERGGARVTNIALSSLSLTELAVAMEAKAGGGPTVIDATAHEIAMAAVRLMGERQQSQRNHDAALRLVTAWEQIERKEEEA